MNLAERTSRPKQTLLRRHHEVFIGPWGCLGGCQRDKQTSLDRQHPHLPLILTCGNPSVLHSPGERNSGSELIGLSFCHLAKWGSIKEMIQVLEKLKLVTFFAHLILPTPFAIYVGSPGISKNPKTVHISTTDPS